MKGTRKVLFVDDDVRFLDMVEKVSEGWSEGAWQFYRATSAAKAMALLEHQPVDLIVLDVNLPGVDGLQLLRVLQGRYAHVPKAMLTGLPDKETQAACLNSGAELFLHKPASLDEMEGVIATLDELAKWRDDSGFRGTMQQVTLPELIQLECLKKSSCVLDVVSARVRGQIFIENGDIVHAQSGEYSGTSALSYLLSLKTGGFNVKPFAEPTQRTIEGSWEGLLMEAAQLADEGGTAFIRKPTRAPVAVALPEGSPTESTSSVSGGKRAPVFAGDPFTPQIEEMLVGTGRGDVLYERNCSKPEMRMQLVDAVAQASRALTTQLGRLDRLDFYEDKRHVVLRPQPEGWVFLSVHHPAGFRKT